MANEFMNGDREVLDAWEESINFTSTRKIYEEAIDILDLTETDEEYDVALATLTNRINMNADGSAEYIFGHDFYAPFINLKGKLYIDKTLYVFTKYKMIIITNGNEEKAIEAKNMSSSCEECGIYIHNSNLYSLKSTTGCGKLDGAIAYSSNKLRRVKANLYQELIRYPIYEYSVPVGWVGGYQTVVKYESHDRRKTSTRWRTYKTRFYMNNAYCKNVYKGNYQSTNNVKRFTFPLEKKTTTYPLNDPPTSSCPSTWGVKYKLSARSLGGEWESFSY